jgi:hypothetical protein
MSHWPEAKAKEKERIIILALPVLGKCGVEDHYGLVPSECGIGHWCGHMVDYDEVGYFFGKLEMEFAARNGLYFLFEQSTRKCK